MRRVLRRDRTAPPPPPMRLRDDDGKREDPDATDPRPPRFDCTTPPRWSYAPCGELLSDRDGGDPAGERASRSDDREEPAEERTGEAYVAYGLAMARAESVESVA